MTPTEITPPPIQLPTRTYTSIDEWWKENTSHYSLYWHERYAEGLKEACKTMVDVKA